MYKWEYMKLSIYWDYLSSMWKLTYKDRHYSFDDVLTVMNELGEGGWEQCTVLPFCTTIRRPVEEDYMETSTTRFEVFFKRVVQRET